MKQSILKQNKQIGMKKILMSFVAVALITFTAHAQQRQNNRQVTKGNMAQKEMRGDTRGNILADLNLTETQKKQLQKLREQGMEERNKIHANTSLTKEQKAEAIHNLRKEHQQKRDAILTPGQRAQMEEKMKQMRSKRAEQGGMLGGENWQALNDTQREQVREINEMYNKKAQEIKDNIFISKDAKQTQLQELQQQKRKAMENLLSPAQKQNMQNSNQRNKNNNPPSREKSRQI